MGGGGSGGAEEWERRRGGERGGGGGRGGAGYYEPGVLYDAHGELPDSSGVRSQHLAIYYSTSPSASATASASTSCIGRITARWTHTDSMCEPTLLWEDDRRPVLCSQRTVAEPAAESVAEPVAHGAEPFYGLDGNLYLVYGAGGSGGIHIAQASLSLSLSLSHSHSHVLPVSHAVPPPHATRRFTPHATRRFYPTCHAPFFPTCHTPRFSCVFTGFILCATPP